MKIIISKRWEIIKYWQLHSSSDNCQVGNLCLIFIGVHPLLETDLTDFTAACKTAIEQERLSKIAQA